eukprot:4866130-Pleurochrysis_carterae.AAC.2
MSFTFVLTPHLRMKWAQMKGGNFDSSGSSIGASMSGNACIELMIAAICETHECSDGRSCTLESVSARKGARASARVNAHVSALVTARVSARVRCACECACDSTCKCARESMCECACECA